MLQLVKLPSTSPKKVLQMDYCTYEPFNYKFTNLFFEVLRRRSGSHRHGSKWNVIRLILWYSWSFYTHQRLRRTNHGNIAHVTAVVVCI